MNGTSLNGVVLPKNTPTPLKHLDKIEFGPGGKLVYKFCLKSVDVRTADASQRSLESSVEDPPATLRSSVLSRESVQRTLTKENVRRTVLYGDLFYYYHLKVKEGEMREKFHYNGCSPQVPELMEK